MDVAADTASLTAAGASEELFAYLVSMKLANKTFSAKAVCTIAYLACRSGAGGAIEKLSLSPLSTGGNFSDHFDKATGINDIMNDRCLDQLCIPGQQRGVGRTLVTYAANLVFDAIANEIAGEANFDDKLAKTQVQLGALFGDHPRVRDNPHMSYVPIAVYQDGVSFRWNNADGCLGFWIINLVTSRRHLALVTRRSSKCACGCRGWCTYHHCYLFMAWLLETMLSGRYPRSRYDGSQWGSHPMGDLSGQALGYAAVPIVMRGDWMEYSSVIGFTSWGHNQHPCFQCKAQQGRAAAAGVRFDRVPEHGGALPWEPKDRDWYESACSTCEVKVRITDRTAFTRVVAALQPDRRERGVRGRRLMADFPSLGLRAGLRVEPGEEHSDIYAIDDLCTNWPGAVDMRFWDFSRCAGSHHRNPLLQSARTGLDGRPFVSIQRRFT